jgi:hypothetical protein
MPNHRFKNVRDRLIKMLRERRTGSRRIEEIGAEHRRLWMKPSTEGPLAVDVIRSERGRR